MKRLSVSLGSLMMVTLAMAYLDSHPSTAWWSGWIGGWLGFALFVSIISTLLSFACLGD